MRVGPNGGEQYCGTQQYLDAHRAPPGHTQELICHQVLDRLLYGRRLHLISFRPRQLKSVQISYF